MPTEPAETAAWAAELWGEDSDLYRDAVRFARHECPKCAGPLQPTDTPAFRYCPKCRLHWAAQHAEADGRAKPGSMVFPFRIT